MGQPQTVKAYSTETGPNPSQSLACLGAFCTSPVTSLYAKAQEMPLKNRCKKLSMNYVFRLKSSPNNTAYSCIFEPPNSKLFEKFGVTPPLGLRILPLFENSKIDCKYQISLFIVPQWGAADAEIKVPSVENTELKRSPFKAWSRSVYSHTCYTYCQRFIPCIFLPFRSIHLHFFQNLSQFFSCVGCGWHRFLCGSAE